MRSGVVSAGEALRSWELPLSAERSPAPHGPGAPRAVSLPAVVLVTVGPLVRVGVGAVLAHLGTPERAQLPALGTLERAQLPALCQGLR